MMLLVLLPAVTSADASNRTATRQASNHDARPNFVVIFCDDLGYGDLGCYGHPTIRTANLDRMAREGQRWTNFYAAASVCTPSRAALLTGRLPVRNGMCSYRRRVLFPDSAGGLPSSEVTIAKALKEQGYATACIGKWHLGRLSEYLPTSHGFDYYFGIPYSNDMDSVRGRPQNAQRVPKIQYWNVPLLRNTEVVQQPADQRTITRRYTAEAVRFIKRSKGKPFFLYFPHTFPHVPLFASKQFSGTSLRGLYGDVVEEIDWSVGQVLDTLRSEGLAENTLVLFTSDNGPWLIKGDHGGSAGLLREGKGSTWEGGMREPMIAWWPGKIQGGQVELQMGSTLDFLPTILHLAGTSIPAERVLDGYDISPAFLGTGVSPRQVMFFYRGQRLYAVRKGPYKAHYVTEAAYGRDRRPAEHDPPLVYHLGHDPSERFNVAADHREVVQSINKVVERHQANLVRGENQLLKRLEGN